MKGARLRAAPLVHPLAEACAERRVLPPNASCVEAAGSVAAGFGRPDCRIMGHMSADESLLRQLVDDYRAQCLWFLRADYYPVSASEREQVLRAIERYGDLSAFRRANEVRRWLSQRSSETTADC